MVNIQLCLILCYKAATFTYAMEYSLIRCHAVWATLGTVTLSLTAFTLGLTASPAATINSTHVNWSTVGAHTRTRFRVHFGHDMHMLSHLSRITCKTPPDFCKVEGALAFA